MATNKSSKYSNLGSGTYQIPGEGTILNGELLDGDNPDDVAKYHAHDDKSRDKAVESLAERDAVIVEIVQSDAPTDGSDKE